MLFNFPPLSALKLSLYIKILCILIRLTLIMVRTAAAGIKVSSGKSGKKGGGSGGGVRSTNSKGGTSSSSNRLPSIPHTETPSWQKPITNFFSNKSETKNNGTNLSSEKVTQIDKNNCDEFVKEDQEVHATDIKVDVQSEESSDTEEQKQSCSPDTKNDNENTEEIKDPKTIEDEPPAKKHKTDNQKQDMED